MREIKFRAWDSRNNEVVYSSESDCFYINTKGVLFMYAVPKTEAGLEIIYHKSYDVDQFTGLKDVNGVEVYEGDIVKDDMGYNYEVVFNGYEFTLEGYYNSSMCSPSSAFSEFYDFKVIGNIHENPELIK